MNANELADFIKDISEYTEFEGRTFCQESFKEAQNMLRQQHAEIEALKAETTKSVMSEHCICYKLGYSQLNDYATVK